MEYLVVNTLEPFHDRIKIKKIIYGNVMEALNISKSDLDFFWKQNGVVQKKGAYNRMITIVGQRIKNDDIETLAALYKLNVAF